MAPLIKNPNSFITILVINFFLIMPCIVNAKVFKIPPGNVAKLIQAINEANGNGQADTIILKPGTYLLTQVDNTDPDGFSPNGLPSIVSNITIIGAGAKATTIERQEGGPDFRIFDVAQMGNLTLDGLSIV